MLFAYSQPPDMIDAYVALFIVAVGALGLALSLVCKPKKRNPSRK